LPLLNVTGQTDTSCEFHLIKHTSLSLLWSPRRREKGIRENPLGANHKHGNANGVQNITIYISAYKHGEDWFIQDLKLSRESERNEVRFQVLMENSMKITVFRDVAPYSTLNFTDVSKVITAYITRES
jgi:hypothetical protein